MRPREAAQHARKGGSEYIIKLHRGATVGRAPQQVIPLNEHVLLQRGMPSGQQGAEVSTQTDDVELGDEHRSQRAADASVRPSQ